MDYSCTRDGAIPPIDPGGRGAPVAGEADPLANPEPVGGDPVDGLEYQPPPPQQQGRGHGVGWRHDELLPNAVRVLTR